jgi:dienelactone hydrolase
MDRRGFLRLGGGLAAGGALAVGGAGYAVEQEWLPGRARLHQLLGMVGDAPVIPDVRVGPIVSGELSSARSAGRAVGWSVLRPYGVRGRLPVVIGLHGRGSNHTKLIDSLHLGEFLTDNVRRGHPPYAIVTVDGFRSSYYHPRDTGEEAGTDMGAVVLEDLLPMLARRKELELQVDRVGFYGYSMGGYGSLRLASILGPERVSGVVATSPAIWKDADDSPAGSFDDADDFREHTLFGHEDLLAGIPVRIDCGSDDPFHRGVAAYREALDPEPAGGLSPGLHNSDFAMRKLPAALAFLSDHATR